MFEETASQATQTSRQEDNLDCPFCGKSCNSPSGLTLHKKSCAKKHAVRPENKETDIDPRISDEEFEMEQPSAVYDDPRPGDQEPRKWKKSQKPQQHVDQAVVDAVVDRIKGQPFFGFGAFAIMSEHIPVFLDINFAMAVGEELIKARPKNPAVLAFAHQLKNLVGESETY